MLALTFCRLEEAMSEVQNRAMGKRVRMIREEFGWTQELLAERIDISSVHLSRLENGKVTPRVDILIRLSKEMHVTVDDLLFGKCSLHHRNLCILEHKLQKLTESEKRFVIRVFGLICQYLCDEINTIQS